jgi:CTP:molybdopterin cytidylyltransferase MocA
VAAAAEPALACLLPAAGGSRRLGQPKQLLEMAGERLVRRAAKLLLGLSPSVVVVTGDVAESVGHELSGLPLRLVHNADWRSGMGGSIAIGMQVLADRPDGVLVLHCDQWRVSAEDLVTLCNAWRGAPECVAAAAFDDTTGPPLIFPRRLFATLRALHGESGAKALVQGDARLIRVATPNARYDLDRPEHLRQMHDMCR